MRTPEEGAMPPEAAAALMAMDATLAGEPADPDYAGLAELALILRADRPVPGDRFGAALDERVEPRVARPARPARSRVLRLRGGLAGRAAGLWAVVVVVLVIGLAGRGRSSNTSLEAVSSSASTS